MYLVNWQITIREEDASSHREAAELALNIMRDKKSLATVFEVTTDMDPEGFVVIDLDQEENTVEH